VLAEITAFLERRLKLKVNADKSAVARPWLRKFLGYSVTWHRKPKLKITQTSRQRFAEKIRQTLRGARGQSLRQTIDQLNPILRGWVAYFRLTEERRVLEELDGWLRRRLRALLWRQWKRAFTRAQNLMRAGLSHAHEWRSATNGHGLWWNSGSPHMNPAYPTSWLPTWGCSRCWLLTDASRRFHEPPDAEPHVRWCGRTAGVTPPPTRSVEGRSRPIRAAESPTAAVPRQGASRLDPDLTCMIEGEHHTLIVSLRSGLRRYSIGSPRVENFRRPCGKC
jgi:hypothetical protein